MSQIWCLDFSVCFVLPAAKRHGEQEDRDLLHGGEEECWQGGEESKTQKMHKHTQTSSQRLGHWKYSAGRNSLCQRGCYTWHSDVQDWLGDFVSDFVCCACMVVCLSVCVWASYLHQAHGAKCRRDSSRMILFTTWLFEREREMHLRVCTFKG